MPDIQGDAPGISCDSELRRCTTPRGAPSPRNTMLLGPHQGCLLFWVKVLSHRPLKCLPSHCLKSGGVCQHAAEPCPLRSWLPAPPGEVSDSRVSLGEKPSRRISPPRALHPIQRVAVLHSAHATSTLSLVQPSRLTLGARLGSGALWSLQSLPLQPHLWPTLPDPAASLTLPSSILANACLSLVTGGHGQPWRKHSLPCTETHGLPLSREQLHWSFALAEY